MRARTADVPRLDVALLIHASPDLVLRAFFDPGALGAWLRAKRSVTTPRTLGVYAIEWPVADRRDEVLGALGGAYRGTVISFEAGRGFFVADGYWLPPEGEPIGPTALTVTCVPERSDDLEAAGPEGIATYLHVEQTGFEESPRWRRYYELANTGMLRALTSMKGLLER
jgi:hypothetical protein